MNEILSMREKRAKLWDATKAFVESRKDANGTLSAEDTATYEKMEADVVRMGKEIERLERQEALDLEFDRPTSRPLVDKPLSPEDRPARPAPHLMSTRTPSGTRCATSPCRTRSTTC